MRTDKKGTSWGRKKKKKEKRKRKKKETRRTNRSGAEDKV